MVEVTKRFRDAVLLDKEFQEAATETLPMLVAAWKVKNKCNLGYTSHSCKWADSKDDNMRKILRFVTDLFEVGCKLMQHENGAA